MKYSMCVIMALIALIGLILSDVALVKAVYLLIIHLWLITGYVISAIEENGKG